MYADAHIHVGGRNGGTAPAAGRLGRYGRPTLQHAARILARLVAQQSPRQILQLRRPGTAREAIARQALLRGARQAVLAPRQLDAASRRIAARLWADTRIRAQLLGLIDRPRPAGNREGEQFDVKRMWRNKIQTGLLQTREIKRRVARGTAAEERRRQTRARLARVAHGMFSRSVTPATINAIRARRGMPPVGTLAYSAYVRFATSQFLAVLMSLLDGPQTGEPGSTVVAATASTAVATGLRRTGLVHQDDVPLVAQGMNFAISNQQEIQFIIGVIRAYLRSRGLHEAEHSAEGWS
jgi:hypothetical protein